jgi:hypothetical protein
MTTTTKTTTRYMYTVSDWVAGQPERDAREAKYQTERAARKAKYQAERSARLAE